MAIATITKYTCDRCKTVSEGTVGSFADGVHLVCGFWGTGYDGAVGGATLKYILCGYCSDELKSFLGWKQAVTRSS